MFLDVVVQIVSRYVMNNPFIWTEELARCLYIWLTFFGTATLMKEWEHIYIDYLLNKLPNSWRKIFRLFIDILILFFLYYVILGSLNMMSKSSKVILPTIKFLSMSDLYLALLIGSICSSLYLIEDIIRNIFYKRG